MTESEFLSEFINRRKEMTIMLVVNKNSSLVNSRKNEYFWNSFFRTMYICLGTFIQRIEPEMKREKYDEE